MKRQGRGIDVGAREVCGMLLWDQLWSHTEGRYEHARMSFDVLQDVFWSIPDWQRRHVREYLFEVVSNFTACQEEVS